MSILACILACVFTAILSFVLGGMVTVYLLCSKFDVREKPPTKEEWERFMHSIRNQPLP